MMLRKFQDYAKFSCCFCCRHYMDITGICMTMGRRQTESHFAGFNILVDCLLKILCLSVVTKSWENHFLLSNLE